MEYYYLKKCKHSLKGAWLALVNVIQNTQLPFNVHVIYVKLLPLRIFGLWIYLNFFLYIVIA
jgi:hypothetical protein